MEGTIRSKKKHTCLDIKGKGFLPKVNINPAQQTKRDLTIRKKSTCSNKYSQGNNMNQLRLDLHRERERERQRETESMQQIKCYNEQRNSFIPQFS